MGKAWKIDENYSLGNDVLKLMMYMQDIILDIIHYSLVHLIAVRGDAFHVIEFHAINGICQIVLRTKDEERRTKDDEMGKVSVQRCP